MVDVAGKLPTRGQKTIDAIFEAYERGRDDWRRAHLGASVIGNECSRAIWYSFRWASPPVFARDKAPEGIDPKQNREGRMLRLFERGNREEPWIVSDLRAAGMEVHEHDPETGVQFRVVLGDHLGGSTDGEVIGVPEAPKTPHLLEMKTHNKKSFKKLVEKGVKATKFTHYVQCQSYMLGRKLTRALYVAVCKDDDQLYVERITFDRKFAEGMVRRAVGIVHSPEPPDKINKNPAFYLCKLCDYSSHCQSFDPSKLERSCRTCAFVTPEKGGTWRCERYDKALDVDEQKAGCESHVFIPSMLPWEVVDADERKPYVTYRNSKGVTMVDAECKIEVVEA